VSVEVTDPPRVTLVGLRVQERPVAGEMLEARFTVPVKPTSEVTVMVDEPVPSAVESPIETVVGLADTMKSSSEKLTCVECVPLAVPFVPVTVTVYSPEVVPVHVSVEVPDAPRVTVVGLSEHEMPVVGEVVSDRVMVPVKPLNDVRVIVDEPVVVPSATTPTLVGLAEMP
jgi:hypothetical protein